MFRLMQRTRRLLLVAIVLLLAGSGASYYIQKKVQFSRRPVLPERLPENVNISQRDWVYSKHDGDIPVVEVRAQHMQRIEEGAPRVQLENVRMKLYHKEGREYDRVSSASAVFHEIEGVLFSDGAVEITLAVPAEVESPQGRLLTIRTSGVRVETGTGLASTEREAIFEFDAGGGSARGASYDPAVRELRLLNDVDLTWRGVQPGALPMRVRAGNLRYLEGDSKVYLAPWSEFERGALAAKAGEAVVSIQEGVIREVIAQQANGSDRAGERALRFGAGELRMSFSGSSQTERIDGSGSASIAALSPSGQTTVRGDRVALEFEPRENESLLRRATSFGNSVLESRPSAKGKETPPGRILRSDVIGLQMHPDGREVAQIETHSPGTLDLEPSAAGQPHRRMTAERMWMHYGAGNRLESFRAVKVATETRRGNDAVARTWSQDLGAEFHPETGEMSKIEQWENFRYEEGERKARSTRAVLDSAANVITLTTAARAWDNSGSVAGDRIVLDQSSGDFTAEGDVTSTRLPDKKTASGAMIAQNEPVQARAQRMVSSNQNRLVEYAGNAVLWQNANRLQADRIRIDREAQTLQAEGNVFNQLIDREAKRQEVVVIRAASLDYSEKDRLAHYRGGVRFLRDGMDVRSRELRAWLSAPGQQEEGSGSRLERALADGDVEILRAESGRTRRASAQHAEYYVAEEKVVLHGGNPRFVDSVKGSTTGERLTWYARNDSLQVDGAPAQPGVSRIRRN